MPTLTSLTFRRVFWHTLRIVIYARICLRARRWLEKSSIGLKGSKLIVLAALLIGSIIYQVI